MPTSEAVSEVAAVVEGHCYVMVYHGLSPDAAFAQAIREFDAAWANW